MSEKIVIPIPPSVGGNGISFLSMSEKIIVPVIAGMNSVVITSSNRLRWLDMLGKVLILNVDLCLNPVTKRE